MKRLLVVTAAVTLLFVGLVVWPAPAAGGVPKGGPKPAPTIEKFEAVTNPYPEPLGGDGVWTQVYVQNLNKPATLKVVFTVDGVFNWGATVGITGSGPSMNLITQIPEGSNAIALTATLLTSAKRGTSVLDTLTQRAALPSPWIDGVTLTWEATS
ncbi:MAG TPA: hypothetical protein VM345_18250 [Acidimicrobiales bacterium]|nr:hypothetical protein [Acidimicrobiales bacterium]